MLTALVAGCALPIPGASPERDLAGAADPGEADRLSGAVPLPWQHELDPPAATTRVRGRIRSIVDGDTFEITVQSHTVTVRLLGIDTPEKPGGPRPGECFGVEASAFAAELTPVGSAVWLSRDVETRDQYGRLLAWIHRDDGVLVNLAMVESGHATALFFSPNDHLEPVFEQAAWRARRDDRGFWAACGGPDVVVPSEPQ